jgi:beta-lactamase class A
MKSNFFDPLLFFFFSMLFTTVAAANQLPNHYDIAYVWDENIENLLDYKEEIATLLGPDVAKGLKIVGRGNQYGLIYDRNGSALSSARVALIHSTILQKAGLRQTAAINENDYFDLYNVCYGLGRNLDELERQYAIIYRYLGKEVGKDLYIEKTASSNYLLIYRRRGDLKTTLHVARRHTKLLRKKKITASIALEKNNQIVRGESSYLNRQEGHSVTTIARAKPHASRKTVAKGQPASPKSVDNDADDSALEKQIEAYIKKLRQKRKILPDEQTAWLVYDFTRGANLVDINADSSLQAASMIKPFVALAFFLKVKEGKLKYGPKSRRKMEAMIQRSDNQSTNWLMRYAGGPKAVQQALKKQYGNLSKFTEIVEYIPTNGRTYRNRAAPSDYGMFLRSLWNQKLFFGKEIRRLMALPGRDRLYNGTPIPQGTMVYNKTGTTAHLCGDMGILSPKGKDGKRYPYSIVGVIEKKKRPHNYSRWQIDRGNVIRKVSSMVYSELKKEYNLL